MAFIPNNGSLPIERARSTSKVTWVSILGLILVPLVIGGLLLWALWNPTERLGQVTAAVVNNDEPVTINEQMIPLGRQLAAGLVAGETDQNYTWVLTDEEDAKTGLADGSYATVVTIPASFSAAATSYSGEAADAKQATVDIQTSERSKLVDAAISQTITSTATRLLNAQLTTTYLENIYVGFNTLHTQLGDAANGAATLADGATQLGSGAGDLANGTGSLANGIGELSTGASGLSAGIGELGAGAGSLADGVGQLGSGASALSEGLSQLSTATRSAADGGQALQGGVQGLSNALDTLASGITAPETGLGAQTENLSASMKTYSEGVSEALTLLTSYADSCTAGDPVACASLQGSLAAMQGTDPTTSLTAGADALASGTRALSDGISVGTPTTPSLASGVSAAAAGAGTLVGKTGEFAAGIGQLADAMGQSATGASQLATGAAGAADGANQLATGASSAADGANQLATGAAGAADGANQLATGVSSLADGAKQLGSGTTSLADGLGTAVGQLPIYTDAESKNLADVVAEPVSNSSPSTDLFGPSGIPFFAIISLWLGALATYLIVQAVSNKALTSTKSSLALALGGYVPGLMIGVVQALALALTMQLALTLELGPWLAFAGISILAGAAFAAVNQGLVALFGGIGRFISMVLAVVALGGGFISTVPPVFDDVLSVLPLSTALNGMQAIVNDDGSAWRAAAGLVIWALAGIAASLFAVARKRTLRVGQLKSLQSSTA